LTPVRRAFIVITLILLVAGGVALGQRWVRQRLAHPGPLTQTSDIVVPRGTTDAVAAALRKAGVIDSERWFRIAVWLTRHQGPVHAAELAFPAHASLRQVLVVLRTARPVAHLLTIPEGLTSRQITALLQKAPAMTGSVAPPPEGSVLPQTYSYEYGTTRTALLARAQAAMAKTLGGAWAKRAPDLPLGSPDDAVILASIIERETALPAERPRVAAVYLNRLRLGMRLDADPTVIYAVTGGDGPQDIRLTRADLASDSAYNTYRHGGLPPTPIDSPGIASVEAVLHPADSDDLYFVADGSGGHAFARTLAAQDRNIAKARGK
jgi:UPF0755 protein